MKRALVLLMLSLAPTISADAQEVLPPRTIASPAGASASAAGKSPCMKNWTTLSETYRDHASLHKTYDPLSEKVQRDRHNRVIKETELEINTLELVREVDATTRSRLQTLKARLAEAKQAEKNYVELDARLLRMATRMLRLEQEYIDCIGLRFALREPNGNLLPPNQVPEGTSRTATPAPAPSQRGPTTSMTATAPLPPLVIPATPDPPTPPRQAEPTGNTTTGAALPPETAPPPELPPVALELPPLPPTLLGGSRAGLLPPPAAPAATTVTGVRMPGGGLTCRYSGSAGQWSFTTFDPAIIAAGCPRIHGGGGGTTSDAPPAPAAGNAPGSNTAGLLPPTTITNLPPPTVSGPAGGTSSQSGQRKPSGPQPDSGGTRPPTVAAVPPRAGQPPTMPLAPPNVTNVPGAPPSLLPPAEIPPPAPSEEAAASDDAPASDPDFDRPSKICPKVVLPPQYTIEELSCRIDDRGCLICPNAPVGAQPKPPGTRMPREPQTARPDPRTIETLPPRVHAPAPQPAMLPPAVMAPPIVMQPEPAVIEDTYDPPAIPSSHAPFVPPWPRSVPHAPQAPAMHPPRAPAHVAPDVPAHVAPRIAPPVASHPPQVAPRVVPRVASHPPQVAPHVPPRIAPRAVPNFTPRATPVPHYTPRVAPRVVYRVPHLTPRVAPRAVPNFTPRIVYRAPFLRAPVPNRAAPVLAPRVAAPQVHRPPVYRPAPVQRPTVFRLPQMRRSR